jgi:hypothetical protein
VYGTATNGVGVYGTATTGSGGQFVDTSPFSVNLQSFGVRATSTSGFGLHAHSDSSYGALITSGGYIGLESSGSSIGVLALTSSTGLAFIVQNTNGATVFSVDGSGNVRYHGVVQKFLATHTGTATAFDAHTTRSSIEDAGSAQLMNGHAVVSLDPVFARTVDPRYPYRVFLTAQGDTPGLYVAAKGAHEFVVRELRGGHGTFAFDYHLYGTALDK